LVEAGKWKLEAGNWKSETRNWKLETKAASFEFPISSSRSLGLLLIRKSR
jgi:hypothetical protein